MKPPYFLLSGLLFLLLFTCQKVATDEVVNLNDNRIGILGHGGLGFPSPENHLPINSWGSIQQAIAGWQADGVEIDVRMSADSLLFLYHDDYLSSLTDCTGCVAQRSAAELSRCRYRQGFNTNIAQREKVIPLEQVMSQLSQRPVRPLVYLDGKINFPCATQEERLRKIAQMARQLARLIRRFDAADWTVIETSNLIFAEQLMQQNPELRLIFAGTPTMATLEVARERNFYGVLFLHRDSDRALVQAAHGAGLRVVLWGLIIRRDVINAVEQSPDWVITDNIPLTIRVLK